MKSNGAFISKKMNYPVAFNEENLIGVAAVEDINDREAVLAVPNGLVINHTLVVKGELK